MDTVARLGGDEFVVLLTDVTIEGATEVARKLIYEDGGESHAPAFLKAPRAPRPPPAQGPAAEGGEKAKARRSRPPPP